MGRLAQIFGFDKRKVWWYRDLALSIVAAIMTLWVVVALIGPQSAFNRRLGVEAAAIAILCWAITPNRLWLFGVVVAVVAGQGWFAVLFSGDARSWWVALPATFIELGFVLRYRNRPITRK